ncbi:MAG: FKBP-type peptidyl-prolyl cis-trans isomerase [Pseudomonadota bacterium]
MTGKLFFALCAAIALGSCSDEKSAGQAYRDAAERMAVARAYLAEVAVQDGVNQTPSGLLYRVDVKGDGLGLQATPQSSILAHYRVQLTDGNEIESSYERNAPALFRTRRLIAGWREGIALMRPGDTFTLFIPPQLAYGARGRPPIIPANAVLIYQVELVDVVLEEDASQ